MVVPRSGYHFQLPAWRGIELLCDSGTFHEMFTNLKTADPLGFNKGIPYLEEIEKNQKKTGLDKAVACGSAKLNGIDIALTVPLEFSFPTIISFFPNYYIFLIFILKNYLIFNMIISKCNLIKNNFISMLHL